MSTLNVRFDANAAKLQLQRILEHKIRALRADTWLYYDLNKELLSTLQKYMPKDTGALKYNTHTIVDNGAYERHGNSHIISNGLSLGAYQIYHKKSGGTSIHSYGAHALERSGTFMGAYSDIKAHSGPAWKEFIDKAAKIVGQEANKA